MSRHRFSHRLHHQLLRLVARVEPRLGGESTTLLVLGALVGVITGGVAVLFVLLLRSITTLVWLQRAPHDALNEDHVSLLDGLADLPWWYPLVVLPAGLVLVSWFVRRVAPTAAGHGVPEVMEAVAERSGRMKAKVGWVKLVASSLNIGLGGSLGKEGPIVQVGSAFGSALGQFFTVKRTHMRTLVGCGSAAGIAAVFNAPIAGVMFALEIIIGAYSLSSFAPVVIASVMGAVTARRFLGTESAFDIPASLREVLSIVTPWEFLAYAVLGLLLGLASVGFTRLTYAVEDLFSRWHFSVVRRAVGAGLIVGALGLWLPQVLGEGHETMSLLLLGGDESLPWFLLLLLALIKTLATAVTLGGGGSGGVFMPSLFVGAMLGSAAGQGLEALFPGQVAPVGAYALAGMAALLAGTAHSPLTGILLMFEMTDNYRLILPLMLSAVLATAVARAWLSDSIYTLKLSRRGILVNDRPDTALLRRLRVADAMQPPVDTISEDARFQDIVQRLLQSDQHDFPVVDAAGHLMGALSLDDLREFLRDEHLHQILVARDCVHPISTRAPHDTLLEALKDFDAGDLYEIPVVSRGRLVGSLRRKDVLRSYRRALLAASPEQPQAAS